MLEKVEARGFFRDEKYIGKKHITNIYILTTGRHGHVVLLVGVQPVGAVHVDGPPGPVGPDAVHQAGPALGDQLPRHLAVHRHQGDVEGVVCVGGGAGEEEEEEDDEEGGEGGFHLTH